jgi:hypothetical protein
MAPISAGGLDLGGVNGGGYGDAIGGGGATDVTSVGTRLLVADGGGSGGRESMTPAELRIGPRR